METALACIRINAQFGYGAREFPITRAADPSRVMQPAAAAPAPAAAEVLRPGRKDCAYCGKVLSAPRYLICHLKYCQKAPGNAEEDEQEDEGAADGDQLDLQLEHSALTLPDWMHDHETPNQPHGSCAVRQSHLETALKSEYELIELLPLSVQNPGAAGPSLGTLIAEPANLEDDVDFECPRVQVRNASMYSEELLEPVVLSSSVDGSSSTESRREARSQLKRLFSTEMWLTLLARTKTQSLMPFLIICLGLLALKSGVPEDVWTVLSFLMIFPSKAWVTRFAKDVAHSLRERVHADVDVSWQLRFVVGDNCDYLTRNVHEHTERSGEYVHTVNWLTVLIRACELQGEDIPSTGWRRQGVSRLDVRERFDPRHTDIACLKHSSWRSFFDQTRAGADILAHPVVAKPDKTEVLFEEPVLDAGTAAYKDVDKWLGVVRRLYCFLVGFLEAAHRRAATVVMTMMMTMWTRR